MARTASRYQRGLSYEPGMATSRYAPTRASADLGQIGDYTGVSPIPGDTGGGAVGVPGGGGSGNGLGSGGNMLAGLALTALTNPRVTDYATRLVRGDQSGAAFNLGRPLDNSVTYGQLTGAPVRDGGVTIEPMAPTTNNGVQFRDLGSQQGGNALTGGARVLDNSLSYEQLMGLPFRPDSGVTISPMNPTTGPGGVQFREVPWSDGGVSGTDGGVSGIDFGGVGDGADAAAGSGGWFSGLQGTAFTPGQTGLDGVVGSGLMGGGFDMFSGAATLGAGALGNMVAGQAGYENGRDPLGRQIGSGLGSAVGGLFLGPVGAFLGAQLGGAIGGQFGPMGTVGANWGALNTWTPDGQGGGSWGYHSGADNGGRVNDPAAQAFQQALLNYAQQQGYQIDPMAQGAQYQVGQYSGNGPNAPGQGWFYQPGSGPQGFQYFYGNDLTAPVMSAGPNGIFGPMTATGQTKGDLMLSNAFNDLLAQGLFIPTGTGLSGDALQTALADRAQQQAVGAANAYQASITNNPGGN